MAKNKKEKAGKNKTAGPKKLKNKEYLKQLADLHVEVVKLQEAKRGFVLLPRRWVVERTFAWMTRFRRLARDYERYPETLAGLHLLAFAVLMLHRFALLMAHCP